MPINIKWKCLFPGNKYISKQYATECCKWHFGYSSNGRWWISRTFGGKDLYYSSTTSWYLKSEIKPRKLRQEVEEEIRKFLSLVKE